MLSRFKQTSDEKISDLKKGLRVSAVVFPGTRVNKSEKSGVRSSAFLLLRNGSVLQEKASHWLCSDVLGERAVLAGDPSQIVRGAIADKECLPATGPECLCRMSGSARDGG